MDSVAPWVGMAGGSAALVAVGWPLGATGSHSLEKMYLKSPPGSFGPPGEFAQGRLKVGNRALHVNREFTKITGAPQMKDITKAMQTIADDAGLGAGPTNSRSAWRSAQIRAGVGGAMVAVGILGGIASIFVKAASED